MQYILGQLLLSPRCQLSLCWRLYWAAAVELAGSSQNSGTVKPGESFVSSAQIEVSAQLKLSRVSRGQCVSVEMMPRLFLRVLQSQ